MDSAQLIKHLVRVTELVVENEITHREGDKHLKANEFGKAAVCIERQAAILMEMASILNEIDKEEKRGKVE